jgi:cell division protein FtsL
MKKAPNRRDREEYYEAGEYAGSGRKTFRWSRSKLPVIVIAALLLYAAVTFGSQFSRLYAMQQDVQQIQAEVAELRQRNADLREQVKLLQSDAYVESIARERLGLVKPGESRIVPIGPESGNAGETGVLDQSIRD